MSSQDNRSIDETEEPQWATYRNLSRESGVVAYRVLARAIEVEFSKRAVYTYTASSAGLLVLREMARLAKSGRGLNTYITKNVKKAFSQKRTGR